MSYLSDDIHQGSSNIFFGCQTKLMSYEGQSRSLTVVGSQVRTLYECGTSHLNVQVDVCNVTISWWSSRSQKNINKYVIVITCTATEIVHGQFAGQIKIAHQPHLSRGPLFEDPWYTHNQLYHNWLLNINIFVIEESFDWYNRWHNFWNLVINCALFSILLQA